MSDLMVRIASFILAASIPFLLALLIRRARSARAHGKKVRWLRSQIARAIEQMSSDEREDVLSGLQTIAFVNDPWIRLAVRPLVERLAKSTADERVAQQAQATLARLNSFVSAEADGLERKLISQLIRTDTH